MFLNHFVYFSFSLNSCLSIINLKSFFAIGAAVELPDPPCSITILSAYLGFYKVQKLCIVHGLFHYMEFQMFLNQAHDLLL